MGFFSRKEKLIEPPRTLPPGVAQILYIPLPLDSIFDAHQKAKLCLYGTRICAYRQKIYQARPHQRQELIEWMLKMDQYHQAILRIAQHAANEDAALDDELNW